MTRPLGWADEWVTGPGPLYSAVFGYTSITFSAWAVLRFPASRLSAALRRFLAAWLLGVPAVEVCLARPQWLGDANATSATWWPYVWTDRRAFDLVANALMVASAVLAVGFLVLVPLGLRTGGTRERTIRLPVAAAGTLIAVVSGAVLVVTALDRPHEEVFALDRPPDRAGAAAARHSGADCLLRRELLGRILILGERHLASVLGEYLIHYNPPQTAPVPATAAPKYRNAVRPGRGRTAIRPSKTRRSGSDQRVPPRRVAPAQTT